MLSFLLTILLFLPVQRVSSARLEAPRADVNDNRIPAGNLDGNVLTIDLEARLTRWFPDGDDDASQIVQAFAEAGHEPQVPGPLIRVPAGTRIRLSIRNALSNVTLTVYGFHQRPGAQSDSMQIAPGATSRVDFVAGAPGTYFYWATTTGKSIENREAIESQLSGAIVVDSANASGPPRDRVFVIGLWSMPKDTTGPEPLVERDQMVINGKSWPHTERFAFTVGDTVRWRWVNPTTDSHPMHLHGFYYDVESRGTWARDTTYARDDRRKVVTELMLPGGTMSTTWVPTVAGHWLFHCHFAFHVSHFLSFSAVPDPPDAGAPDAVDHSVHGMRGLVLGIDVRDRPGVVASAAPRSRTTNAFRLLMQSARARYDTSPGYGFVMQRAERTPARIRRDSVPTLSPTLVLKRGETTRITVINHLRAPSAVHWHGIELTDSYYDGVPGWSGTDDHVAPLIAPNDSFTVEFAPPRAGTFMYHSHSNESHQINSGLYGALVVLDAGQKFDTTTERVFVIGGDGPGFEHGRVNGQRTPAPMTLVQGRTYRFRVVQIDPEFRVVVSLKTDTTTQRWRPIAKDGADLPPHRAVPGLARILMGPGETSDFEVTPRTKGVMRLEVRTHLDGWSVSVPLRVR